MVEQPTLEELQSLGWLFIEGASLSPEVSNERSSLKEVVLVKRLTASIQKINPWINEINLRKVVNDLTINNYINLVDANQSIWKSINQCVTVTQDQGEGNKGQTVQIIDFKTIENNDFICTRQLKVKGSKQTIIPDIVLFVNGLPLVVIECKSPYMNDPFNSGINQLLRYANRRNPEHNEGAERLFYYNLMMVCTNRYKSVFGTITSPIDHFLEWKDPYPLKKEEIGFDHRGQQVLISVLLNKQNLLDILQNFTVFESSGGQTLKKIARYQQFRAVHKIIKRIKSSESTENKGGTIWHTQGSGKSLTMVFLALKIRKDPYLRDHKLIFLVDRIQLDHQLTTVFQKTLTDTVHRAFSINNLIELLSVDTSDIIISTVQKFEEGAHEFRTPNESEKIIVISDEAHRTQYGSLGAAIRKSLPNALHFGFTGTPLIKSQKTVNTFGTYLDAYTIEQAVKDKVTIQILYEGREVEVKVTGDSLDNLFEKYFKKRSRQEREDIKKKFGTKKAVLEAPKRIEMICRDIKKHYEDHIQPNGFKAMIVTSSRKAAIMYKKKLDELGAPRSAVIISRDHNDEKQFWEYTDSAKQKKQIEDFKKPMGFNEHGADLSILIVKNMLLTGFDAPVAQVMYLDAKLVEHNLLQAIARVNRVEKNKSRGYIIDYYGLSDYMAEALKMFSTEDVAGALIELKEEIPRLKNAHNRVLRYFKGLDIRDTEACILSLNDEINRQSFQADFKAFSKIMDIILPDSAAAPFIGDLKRLGKISVGSKNLYRDEQLSIYSAGKKVSKLIEEHIHSTGVNLRISPLDLFDSNFKEELRKRHTSSHAKAYEIEHAIRYNIKLNLGEDPEYYKKLSKKLEDIISRNKEKWDELVQILLDFRDDIHGGRNKEAEEHGLTLVEQSFYNGLMAELVNLQRDNCMDARIQENAKDIIRVIVKILRDATQIVDFFDKWDERKRVRRKMRRILISEYDELIVKPLLDRFMELAEVKFKDGPI